MGLYHVTHVHARCDGCGDDWLERLALDGLFFDDVYDALNTLAGVYGWTTTGRRMWCEQCAAERACAEQGHQWDRTDADPWRYDELFKIWTPNFQVCTRCACEVPISVARGLGHPEHQPDLLTAHDQTALAVLERALEAGAGERS